MVSDDIQARYFHPTVYETHVEVIEMEGDRIGRPVRDVTNIVEQRVSQFMMIIAL